MVHVSVREPVIKRSSLLIFPLEKAQLNYVCIGGKLVDGTPRTAIITHLQSAALNGSAVPTAVFRFTLRQRRNGQQAEKQQKGQKNG